VLPSSSALLNELITEAIGNPAGAWRIDCLKKEDVMTTVITVNFETENAIFQFTVEDVRDHLGRSETEYGVREATVLKDLLSSATGDSITMPKKLRLFPYIALNLIRDSKWTV
jgi:hypothetical protein